MPSLNRVNGLFRYGPGSGKLFWRNRFNNKEAGTIKKDTGYIRVKALGKLYYAHRIIMPMLTGGYDERLQADRADHNRLNGRPDNLRLVTRHGNLKSVSKTKAKYFRVRGRVLHYGGQKVCSPNIHKQEKYQFGLFQNFRGGRKSTEGRRNQIRISPQPRFINSLRATDC